MDYKPENSKLFGAAIKHLLKQKSLSQRKFAVKAELTTDYVSKLVNGKVAEPRQEQRRKIAKGLGVTEAELQKLVDDYIGNYGDFDISINTDVSGAVTPTIPVANNRHIYHNLTSPDYTAFIGRKEELSRLLKYLSPDNPNHVITIYGIGGIGKTALIQRAAFRCLEASKGVSPVSEVPEFDAIIFTSAKNRRLTADGMLGIQRAQRNLSDIFREIAITLDRPGITQASVENQLEIVRESLRNQRTLLIVDNMETIEAIDAILDFLIDLPLGVKAVITTRDRRKHHHIRLESLPKVYGIDLIKHQASEIGILLTDDECEDIYKATEGIPVAIVYAIGQIASGYSVQTVLNRIASATGDVAHFLFKDCVQQMRGEPEHKLLMSLAMFPDPPVRDAVAEVAGLIADRIDPEDGLVKLQDLGLIQIQPKDGRYTMLSLTREYAKLELVACPDFHRKARERWINWYLDFAKEYGGEDWEAWHIKFNHLENEWGNLLAVLYWCKEKERYENVRDLWQSLNDFMRLYGYWQDRIDWLEWLIEASKEHGELATTVDLMACKGWTLTQMGGEENLKAAEKLFEEAWNLRDQAEIKIQADLAYCRADFYNRQKNYDEAEKWLNIQEELVNQANLEYKDRIRGLLHVYYNRGKIKYSKGEYDEAKKLFEKDLNYAKEIGWQRAEIDDLNYLGDIAIQEGDLEKAEELLNKGLTIANRNQHKRRIACYQASFARLEKARKNSEKCREWATKALDGFKRLGMTKDAEEMQNLLTELDGGNQASREKLG